MFAVNDAICTNLRAKKKWRKETCCLCSVPVSKCEKLDRDEEERSRKFDERPDFIRENVEQVKEGV